jgi:hypothetical protein
MQLFAPSSLPPIFYLFVLTIVILLLYIDRRQPEISKRLDRALDKVFYVVIRVLFMVLLINGCIFLFNGVLTLI